MAQVAEAIGVISGLIGIFQFGQDLFNNDGNPNAGFRIAVADDGTGAVQGPSNSGGNAPDVRIWSPTGEFLGITTNDNKYCQAGDIVCDFQIDNIERAPDYALFTANDDAICMTSITTTYPDSTNRAVVIGNWAEECSNNYGVSTATWYYTVDKYQTKDDGSINVKCSWIDSNGDQPTTGIQVYWPDYDNNVNPADGTDTGHFCNNHPTLFFHTDNDPNTVTFYTSKRNIFASHPSEITSPAQPRDMDEHLYRLRNTPNKKTKRTGSSHQFAHRLVKSSLPDQSASYLCSAPAAAGPSFVSQEERKFCHMPTKTLFSFCEDVDSGACWNDNLNLVTPKLIDILVPEMNFTNIAEWTSFIEH